MPAYDISTDPSVLDRVTPSTRLAATMQAVTTPPPAITGQAAADYKAKVEAAEAQTGPNAPAPTGGGGAAATPDPAAAAATPQLPQIKVPDQSAAIDKAAAEEKLRDQRIQARIDGEYRMLLDTHVPVSTPPPAPKQTNPLEAWGSMAMMVAVMGGLMTRGHATTALKAATGVLDAIHKGDIEQSQAEFERWKAANENMQQTFKFQMDRLNADREITKDDADLGAAMFNADMKAFGMHNDEVRNTIDMDKTLIDMGKAQTDAALYGAQLELLAPIQMAMRNRMKQPDFTGGTPEKQLEILQPFIAQENAVLGKAGAAGAGAILTPQEADAIVDTMATGDLAAARLMMSRLNPQERAQIVQQGIAKYGPGFGARVAQADIAFAGKRTAAVALARRSVNAEFAANEAFNLVPVIQAASEKVWRTRFVPFNELELQVRRKFADQDVRSLDTYINGFINMYGRSINPSGGGGVTDREHAREMILAADSREAFEATLQALQVELDIAKTQGPQLAWEQQVQNAHDFGLPPPARPEQLDQMQKDFESGKFGSAAADAAAASTGGSTTTTAKPADKKDKYEGFSIE